jgi:hypothetical protein
VLVGDDEIAIVLVLEAHAIFDAADQMAEMEPPGRRIAGKEYLLHARFCL